MRLSPIANPSVWTGTELSQRGEWIHHLSSIELGEINQLHHQDAERIEKAAPHLHERLLRIQQSLELGTGAVMIRGLQLEDRAVDQWADFFQNISAVVGQPISQSASGQLIFSVRDAGFADNDKRARGPNTRKKLSFHTDRCDVIGFLCLQQAKSGGENQLVSSGALFNQILDERPDLLSVLMQPFRYLRHTIDTQNDRPYTEQPIFSFCEGYFAANFLRVLIDRADAHPDCPNLSTVQKEALDFLESVAARPEMHHTFRQQPGDILFLNNWVTMHRRTAFEDHESEALRRHILRVWLSMPNSRPIDPMFAGNYGATAAGAIRGGIRAAN